MRRLPSLMLPGVLLLALAPAAAAARTWRVAPLGTVDCDFRDIQPAVVAAAPGDTISIAPGWYWTLHTITAPAWTEETIVPVTKDDLTFIGAGVGRTYIGMPHYYAPAGAWPMVICSVEAHDATFRDITFLNMQTGIYWWQGRLTISNCSFQDLGTAVQCMADEGRIEDCAFDVSNGGTAISCGYTDAFTIERCAFTGAGHGIAAGELAMDVTIADCTFNGILGPIGYALGSTGTVRDVTITDAYYQGVAVGWDATVALENVSITCLPSAAGVLVGSGAMATLESVRCEGGQYGLTAAGFRAISGRNLALAGATVAAFRSHGPGTVALRQSHLLPASGLAVDAFRYGPDYGVLDLTGNWWGTTDPDAIAALIRDGNDDPVNRAYVDYHPFAGGEVPVERTTWGELKASFR